MEQKILSLCYPTYNRGWCMKQQIERLKKCPQTILDKIEILISDNCSTDDTQAIVQKAISEGFQCTYIRNQENLGMDGNFVNCFQRALGKYVWLLGDDDLIIIESLIKIIEKLDCDKDYGLLHIDMNVNPKEPDFISYRDDDDFCKRVNCWFSFISGNIAQTKYIPNVDFEKYKGTWFTLIPVYFESLHNERENLVLNFKVLDDSKDAKRNGGYNFFQVFAANFNKIMYEFASKGYISIDTRDEIKKNIADYNIEAFLDFVILRKKSNYKITGAFSILLKEYGGEPYFYKKIICHLIRRIKSRTNKVFYRK